MKDAKLEVVRAWFKKAENDLRTAEYTMTMDDPPYDTVCFHTQQCAEKYLKGFLAFHKIDFPKTHSLEDLVELCKRVVPEIETYLEMSRFFQVTALKCAILMKFITIFPKKMHKKLLI